MIELKQKSLNILTSDFRLSSTVQPSTIVLFCRCQIIGYYLAQNIYPIIKKDFGSRKIYEVLEVIAARHLYFSQVLAARKKNLTTARACKNKNTARMLAKARKDHWMLHK